MIFIPSYPSSSPQGPTKDILSPATSQLLQKPHQHSACCGMVSSAGMVPYVSRLLLESQVLGRHDCSILSP